MAYNLHGEPIQDCLEVMQWCRAFLSDFHSQEEGVDQPIVLPGNVRSVWRPPDIDCYKINCDAAMDSVGGRIGFGVVIRDHLGFVLASCSQVMAASFGAAMAETMAIYRGLLFSRDCGLGPCHLESDAVVIVKRINEGSHLDSESEGILAEISSRLSNLKVRSVNHVPRLANCVAHGLAKFALKVVDDLFWMEDYPPCVRKAVLLDMPR
ncbi:hypothetical protein LWI29_033421 [Acer saccharum]|uniref:RNase H type-1 domain-containing protein n=1 Tax=Acer saccharum TaxID=4024 RepID=A0AA39W3F3_ACESA|nr:hypothetical protein LWI29_033421 [Acer saccharum]